MKQALSPVNGRVTLTAGLLPGAHLEELLAAYNGNLPLIIDGATLTATAETVTVSGTASFQNASQLPVTGTFQLDADGNPLFTLRFILAGPGAGPNPWRFSTSFPKLPLFMDVAQSLTRGTVSLLDQLLLHSAAFLLTNQAGTDAESGAPLVPGLNWAGRVQPSGLLGLFDALIGATPELLLYGLILAPSSTAQTPALPSLVNTWQVDWPVPGIHLQADLGADWALEQLSLTQTKLRIYSPLSTDWMAANRSYQPLTAVSGTLVIPSAKISAEVAAQVVSGENHVILSGEIEGASLSNLANLADVAGGGSDLAALLPDEVQKGLGDLSLVRIGISLTGSLSATAVDYAYFTIGLPGLTWTIWPEMLTIGELTATFLVSQPFTAARHASVQLGGLLSVAGAGFDILTEVPGFRVRAELMEDATLPLSKLFTEYLPELPAPPDLTVNEMVLSVDPGNTYAMDLRMADDPGWTLELGPAPLTVSGVALSLAKTTGASATGSFGGSIAFGDDLDLTMRYDLPGDFMLRADLPQVKLSQLIAQLDEIGIELPSGFDITFAQTYVLIKKQGAGLVFTAASYIDQFGLVAFTAGKQGQWGFAAGIDLDVAGIAALPGLEALAAFDSFVGLEKVMLVVSTLSDPGFTFPSMTQFRAPALADKSIRLPAQASGVVKGLNFYAGLSTAKSQGFRTLADWLGLKLDGTLGVTVAVGLPNPATDSKLFLTINQEIAKGITLKGQLGGMLQGGNVGAFLSGIVNTSVQGEPAQFDVTAAVLSTGVLVSGTAKGTFAFEGIQLSNLGLVVGIDWAGIPSLGVAATIDVGQFDSSVALFFDSTQPGRSMVAGAVSGITLAQIATTLAGQSTLPKELTEVLEQVGLKEISAFQMDASVAGALDGRDLSQIAQAFQTYGKLSIPATASSILLVVNEPGKRWHLTDMSQAPMTHYSLTLENGKINVGLQPQLYLVPMDTQIGTLTYRQGMQIEGELDFLMLKGRLQTTISTSKGIAADAYLSRITIYDQQFFALSDASGKNGPMLSLSTYQQPTHPIPEFRSPHFLLSSKLRVLGVDLSDVYVKVGKSGLQFNISQQASPLLRIDLNGHFDSLTNLGADGTITYGLKQTIDLGPLGKVNFNDNVSGGLGLQFDGKAAAASLQGSFHFAGESFTIPKFQLVIGKESLANIGDVLSKKVAEALKAFLSTADKWLAWVKQGLIVGVNGAIEVARVLATSFKQSAGQVVAALKALGFGLSDLVKALDATFKLDPASMIKELTKAGYAMLDVAKEVTKFFNMAPSQLVKALSTVGVSANEIAKLVGSIFGLNPTQVLGVLKSCGYGTALLAQVGREAFGMSAEAVSSALKAIGVSADEIATVLKSVYGWSANQVADFFKKTLHYGDDAVNGALKAAGYSKKQIEKAMDDVFNWAKNNLDPRKWF